MTQMPKVERLNCFYFFYFFFLALINDMCVSCASNGPFSNAEVSVLKSESVNWLKKNTWSLSATTSRFKESKCCTNKFQTPMLTKRPYF